ncbi:MAG: hypothetical protein J3T61_00190 [Candidatus Brocadiales bacterium]|nr:hypothetical protein [Candidatus Bathyanammoxibius sp.]
MTITSRTGLKAKFETGDTPVGSDYVDWIDSYLHLTDATVQSITSKVALDGGLSTTTVSGANAVFTGAVSALSVVGVSAKFDRASLGPASEGNMVGRVKATILQNNTAGNPVLINVPSGADILEFLVDIETPFETAAGATACNIEASLAAAGSALGRINVSASGRYDLIDDGTIADMVQFRNVTATIEVHASIQNSATAITTGQGILTVWFA